MDEVLSNLEGLCLQTRSHMAVYVGLELLILLPQPLECSDYRPCRGNRKAGQVSHVQDILYKGINDAKTWEYEGAGPEAIPQILSEEH